MRKFYTLLFFSLILLSCSREDDAQNSKVDNALMTKLNLFIFDPFAKVSQNETDSNYEFEYDNEKRLIRKIGGFLYSSNAAAAGVNSIFSKKVYTTLLYNGNNVTVEQFYNDPIYTMPKNTKYITLNTAGQITTKVTPDYQNKIHDTKETYQYTNGKLSVITTTLPNEPYDPKDPNDYIRTYSEKFFYDAKGNLSKTEYYELQNGIPKGKKILRTFENYDNSTNPTKSLTLLNEYFYRSLSKNNFRKYTEIVYYMDYEMSSAEIGWVFDYDAKGNVITN